MAEQKNRDMEKEQNRVKEVLSVIETRLQQLQGTTGDIKENIVELRRTFWDDVTVNLDEPDDVIETHTSLKQQAELLAERERRYGLLSKQRRQLEMLKNSPYFGRIDFKEEGEESAEPIYIGLFSLNDDRGQFLIYDWRAPISSMYYDYTPGPCQYETMDGPVKGIMELKRQFIIRNGIIKGMFDTGITIGDEILQQVLSKEADPQMKSIVATIQKEQNAIIRHVHKKYLIVQGSAGSGKTSAALQRMAYFLYRYRGKLTSNNMLLFSPNPLFSSYISNVLPELGEENIEQSTFFQFLQHRLGKGWELENPFIQIEFLMKEEFTEEEEIRRQGIHFKASLDYKKLIDYYVEKLSKTGLKFRGLMFRSEPFVTPEEIRDYFYRLNDRLPIPNRIHLVKEWLYEKLKEKEIEEKGKEWVEEERELLSHEEYVKAYRTLQREKRFSDHTFNDFAREEELLSDWVIKKRLKPLKRKIDKLGFLNLPEIYKGIFSLHPDEVGITLPENMKEIGEQTAKTIDNHVLSYEDATPYLYLMEKLVGKPSYSSIKHLFVDEAQDYSPFQMAYIRETFSYSKMTILGDVHQSVFTYNIKDHHFLEEPKGLFPEEDTDQIVLLKSYRSTKPITDFSLAILRNRPPIEPFHRKGLLPVLHQIKSQEELHGLLKERIEELKKEYETIAILCKTMDEAELAYEDLKTEMDINLIKKDTRSFQKGIHVIPIYLAKGIEFDAVLIYNCAENRYRREEERTIFYAACTRAMHVLELFTVGKVTSFLKQVPSELYEVR